MAITKQVVFFIGSGCSFLSKQPSVGDITKQCLEGTYYLLEPMDDEGLPRWGTKRQLTRSSAVKADLSAWRRPASSIQGILTYLSSLDLWRHAPNYEDIAGVVNYIAAAVAQEKNDPLAEAFIRKTDLVARLNALEFPPGHRYFRYSLSRKLVVVEDFIGWVIATALRTNCRLNGYEALMDAIRFLEEKSIRYHFVTTNYDCNLERLFRIHKVRYTDGLVTEKANDGDGHVWEYGNRFRFVENDVPWLVKLHGSMNWYLCQGRDYSIYRSLAKVAPSFKPTQAFNCSFRTSQGVHFIPMSCPYMLRGSLTKAQNYSYDIHSQLLMAFERTLEQSDIAIVAGFGWSDEAIVARLYRFVRTEGKVLLVFDGTPNSPDISKTVPFTEKMLRKDGNRESLILVRKHMSDLGRGQCKRYLREALS